MHPVFACARGVVRKRGVMRARDSLKPGLVPRLPNKALFYYKHYDVYNESLDRLQNTLRTKKVLYQFLHTVILSDCMLKKCALYSFAFQSF